MPLAARNLPSRIRKVARSYAFQVRAFNGIAADNRSRVRFALDAALCRVLRYWRLPGADADRSVTLKNGVVLSYRLNRGDLQSITEVWLAETYRVSPERGPRRLLDLGANIGLTALWLWKEYGCEEIVAVEPDPQNATLLRRNVHLNAVPATVVEAAVARSQGTRSFMASQESNLGRLDEAGDLEVATVTVDELLQLFSGPVDFVKIDVEGAEAEIVTSSAAWLHSVQSVWIEIHRCMDQVAAAFDAAGFSYEHPLFVRRAGRLDVG